MKVSGVCGAANLYRQSAMSFNLYFQTLLCATLSQADTMTAQQVEVYMYICVYIERGYHKCTSAQTYKYVWMCFWVLLCAGS